MSIIEQLHNFLQQYTKKYVLLFLVGYAGAVALGFSGLLLWHYNQMSGYKQRHKKILQDRQLLAQQLGLYRNVQKQKEKVDKMLSQDELYLQEYFQETAQAVGIGKQAGIQKTKKVRTLDNGYDEEVLHVQFKAQTQQVVQFLQAVEKTQRVYIKYVEITKNTPQSKTITLQLELATLLPKAQALSS